MLVDDVLVLLLPLPAKTAVSDLRFCCLQHKYGNQGMSGSDGTNRAMILST